MRSQAEFEIALEGPLDFAASLEMFRRSGDDLLDRWDGTWLTRTVLIDGHSIPYTCRPNHDSEHPALYVIVEDAAYADPIASTIRRSFAALTDDFIKLCRADPILGRLAELHRGFRPMLHPELTVALIRCISAQQVNLRWAATVRRRLAEKYGRRHEVGGQTVYSLESARLAECAITEIRALQFTMRKAEYVINVARALAKGDLGDELATMPDDEVIARVTAVRGLGLWSAEWVLARTLGRPRVSAYDLGVRKAVGKAYFAGRMPTPDEVREATAHWGTAAALAQELLLHAQHLKTLEAAPASVPASRSRRPRVSSD
jgi:DNA-3-methyladenine glycosylase II